MQTRSFRHMPIVKDNKLVGVHDILFLARKSLQIKKEKQDSTSSPQVMSKRHARWMKRAAKKLTFFRALWTTKAA